MQSSQQSTDSDSFPAKYPKLIINIFNTKYKVVKDVAKELKYKVSKSDKEDWDLCWIDTGMTTDKLFKMKPYQKINHFPGMFAVARKNFLGKNLQRMKKAFPKEFTFFPTTYLLPADWNEFKARFLNKKPKTFIVKPEASCQGQGIFLTRTYTDLVSSDHYVVQRYIHKPYLIDGLKFDLRIYALILGCDPMRIYIYDEGLARFATEEYKGPLNSNLNNLFMHLTNYAINKNSENFIFNNDENKADTGHKRSLSAIWKIIDENGGSSINVREQIESIIVKTMCAVQPTLQNIYKSCQGDSEGTRCFEILGFDILLDHKLKAWLLEVNHSPSFSVDTPFDYKVKFDLISNTIHLMNFSAKKKSIYKSALALQVQSRTAKKQGIEQIHKLVWKEEGFNENEKKYIGHYKIIYPIEEIDYDRFIRMARDILEESTGIKRKPKEDIRQIRQTPIKKETPKPKFTKSVRPVRKLVPAEEDSIPCESPASNNVDTISTSLQKLEIDQPYNFELPKLHENDLSHSKIETKTLPNTAGKHMRKIDMLYDRQTRLES